MPKKTERCVKKVKAQGKSESSSWAICKAAEKKAKTGKKKKSK